MQVFTRQQFTDGAELGVAINLELSNEQVPVFRAHLSAEGSVYHRAIWRKTFIEWSASHNAVISQRKGNSRKSLTSQFDFYSNDWATINAFVLKWAGLNWLRNSLKSEKNTIMRFEYQLERLSFQIKNLSDMLRETNLHDRIRLKEK